ncbi:MAG TPA: hypothetical protein VM367_11550 [Pseudonocardia sp.]|jgi:hypothetical protein|nr:hypothetical protein [Pseudonocardia sp.]
MNVPAERLTDDSIKVRQVTHHQFSFVPEDSTTPGTFTLQLVLDEGAWEEVVSLAAQDAEVLQNLLRRNSNVHYDINRRVLMFGTRKVGDS